MCLDPLPSGFSLSVLIGTGYCKVFLRAADCFSKYELVTGLSLFNAGRAWGVQGVPGVLRGKRGAPGMGAELSLRTLGSLQPPLCSDAELQGKGGAASLHAHLLGAALVCSGGCCQWFLFIQVAGTGM